MNDITDKIFIKSIHRSGAFIDTTDNEPYCLINVQLKVLLNEEQDLRGIAKDTKKKYCEQMGCMIADELFSTAGNQSESSMFKICDPNGFNKLEDKDEHQFGWYRLK